MCVWVQVDWSLRMWWLASWCAAVHSLPPSPLLFPLQVAGRVPSLRAHGPVALLPPWYAWQGVAVLLGSLGLVCPQLVGEGKRRSVRVWVAAHCWTAVPASMSAVTNKLFTHSSHYCRVLHQWGTQSGTHSQTTFHTTAVDCECKRCVRQNCGVCLWQSNATPHMYTHTYTHTHVHTHIHTQSHNSLRRPYEWWVSFEPMATDPSHAAPRL